MIFAEINKLKELDFTKQKTFAYLTCERLYPNYLFFSENYDFGNQNILREAIDFLYLNLFETNLDKTKINSLVKKVEENTPDTSDFSTIYVSSALDACTCILDSLHFLLDKDFLKLTYISSCATDTVDMYIQEIENIELSDKDFRHKVDSHPLMKKEFEMQSGIIAFLSNSKNIDHEDIQTLLRLQENNKKSNINL